LHRSKVVEPSLDSQGVSDFSGDERGLGCFAKNPAACNQRPAIVLNAVFPCDCGFSTWRRVVEPLEISAIGSFNAFRMGAMTDLNAQTAQRGSSLPQESPTVELAHLSKRRGPTRDDLAKPGSASSGASAATARSPE